MPRRTAFEIANWKEKFEGRRAFVHALIPRGLNEQQPYAAAKRIADRYEIKRFFASGGFGLLLVAEDTRTENDVLIKTTLRYDVAVEAAGRDRDGLTRKVWARRQQLQTERRILVQLRNRGCEAVPTPNDYVFDRNPLLAGPYPADDGSPWSYDDRDILDTEPYLVLEMIDGRTLESLLETRFAQGMDEAAALTLLRPVADALRLLHQGWNVGGQSWKMVYNDLKPANLMLGPHDRAYLLDLGGCRVAVNGKLASAGAHTPGYCAPECTLARMEVGPPADSYALGATLYHLLTGRSPLSFLPKVIRADEEQAVAPERWDWAALEKRASAGVTKFVRACLSPSGRDRPADGVVLAAELRRLGA